MELLDQFPSKNKQVNLKREILRYLRKWPWFLLSILLFYVSARLYLRYAQPQYLSKTSLMLSKNNSKNNAPLTDLKSLGVGVSDDKELEGETVVIVSKPILAQVVSNLGLNVSYYSLGNIKETEMYQGPLKAVITSVKNKGNFLTQFCIVAPDGNNRLKIIEGEGAGQVIQPGHSSNFSFGTVLWNFNPGSVTAPIKVVFRSVGNTVSWLENSVNVSIPEDKGYLMELSMVGTVPEQSEGILNEITRQYNIDGVKDKNAEAENTQNFINERLEIISHDLSGIENEKEQFKRTNRIADLTAQANLTLGNINSNTQSYLEGITKLNLVQSIYDMSNREQLLPTNMGLSPTTENYIGQYNTLLMTRNRVLKQATPKNPSVIQLNLDIEDARTVLRKNLAESKEALQTQISQVKQQMNEDNDQIRKYPTQEKIFRNIDRQQQLKEQIYLYLLQKREENAITLAFTVPKGKVVNPAYTLEQVRPNVKQVTMGSLAVGFLLPLLVFFTLFTLDTKIRSRQQLLSQASDIPILGEIPVDNDGAIVKDHDFSIFAESFRILTSNLKYLLKAKHGSGQGTILVTSSIKGEGKTTVSINMALTLSGKNKVIILGADIRNPQLRRFMQDRNVGITDYLVSDDQNPEKYIYNSQLHPNLDVMFSGAIAPNPNDLLDMDKFDTMVAWLKSRYDYVVIDSAPVMLVSDTLNLLDVSDILLYVVKAGYTDKEMLDYAKEFRAGNQVDNMAFVLNAVQPGHSRYGSKYAYGYHAQPSVKQRFFKKTL
ncbi:capsular exopolysaccharide family [Epilithonimonas bovis DSM 19482]|uniref:non-specific protein-tyrosine kinase n=1 Tax=Epilithonimonas bovis DSM 19482 TaxID=1121284 RepID=A0A1U7PW67_9FLAO|nr:tyrosine-protein kinase [Epilithonimonas bovis]SIT96202.1 capsular exopolysaccharide family [Epilithonimonas bovis DSM 19482]